MKKFLVCLCLIVTMVSTVEASEFRDIQNLWCEDAVENLTQLGIINGVSNTEYAPRKSVTRAELAKMVTVAFQLKKGSSKSFTDIANHWGKESIESAASAGILNGYEDGSFRPNQEVSYAEAIAILLRTMGYHDLESSSGSWYRNYIEKMNEIKLYDGIEKIIPENYANRGDVAVLFWNAMRSREKGTSLLEQNFEGYEYFENERIKEITYFNNRIAYVTDHYVFYVDYGIDFGNLGGIASGFLHQKDKTVVGLKIEDEARLKRIVGSTKKIKEMGYDTFTVDNIWGYGNKEMAQYMEVFVNPTTNLVERAVYFDTSESHFAEKLKVGTKNITIEEKHVYDNSIVYLKDGTKITYHPLRTESVKEISSHAIIIGNGKVVPWNEVPSDSVIREIKKNLIYTYTHQYEDVSLEERDVRAKDFRISGEYYPFAEDCLAQNIKTDVTVKLKEDITTQELKKIVKNDETNRVYWNEFEEIVKIEFQYDIWKEEEEKKEIEVYRNIEKDLKRVGIINNLVGYVRNEKYEEEVSLLPYPKTNSPTFANNNYAFSIGDFAYFASGDKNLAKITNSTKTGNIKVIPNYTEKIVDDKIGVYRLLDNTQYVEVLCEMAPGDKKSYASCKMNEIAKEDIQDIADYKTVHMILNLDDEVVRIYLIKEIGTSAQVGLIFKMEDVMSGDKKLYEQVTLQTGNVASKKYQTSGLVEYEVGDLVIFEIETVKPITTTITRGKKKITTTTQYPDKLKVLEVYKHQFIGNEHDLIVSKNNNKVIYFENSDDVINLKKEKFYLNEREYSLNMYIFVKVEVKKDKAGKEWLFTNVNYANKETVIINPGDRVAIDELSRVIVVYKGYEEK